METKVLDFGLGLRSKHYDYVLANRPQVDWFEVISENFMIPGGRPRRILRQICERYPVILHGVSLSLGSPGEASDNYLKRLKNLIDEVNPPWFSDHLCWTSLGAHYSHDLLPLPYTEETLERVCRKIDQVQNFMRRQMLVENVSSYVLFKDSEMTEWQFLTEIVQRTDCKLLLDVNNIYVSSRNHRFSATDFINGIPKDSVGQFHLAGHTDNGTHVIDTHDQPVRDEVWDLYRMACRRFGKIPTMIERDGHIPEFPELFSELQRAEILQKETLNEKKFSRRNSGALLEESHIP